MDSSHPSPVTRHRPLALIGANGMLARKVCELVPEGYEVVGYDLPGFDITDRAQVLAEMERLQPAVIVNCAAFTHVDGCETQEGLATRVNGDGPGYLAEAARKVGAVLVHISTDYVYSGQQTTPYREIDPTGPLSAYGRSKLAGEAAIVADGVERYFIIRTSWLYGPGGKNFVETMLRLACEREELRVVSDQVGTPTYTGDLAVAIYKLLETVLSSDEPVTSDALRVTGSQVDPSPVTRHPSLPYGIYNFSNLGECSWHAFAEEIVAQARCFGLAVKAERVVPIRTAEYPLPATRPSYSVFSKEKYLLATGATIPPWQEALAVYLRERVTSSA